MDCAKSQASLAAKTTVIHQTAVKLLLAALTMVASIPALAHASLDGQTTQAFWQAVLPVDTHSVLGMDHLVFILTIGVSEVFACRKVLVGGCAMLGVFIGVALALGGIVISNVEVMIAVSLIGIGVCVLSLIHI